MSGMESPSSSLPMVSIKDLHRDFNPQYDARLRKLEEDTRRIMDAPDDGDTSSDEEVLEAKLDACPSPQYKSYSFWTLEYEARRRAKRPLISPPLTPPHVRAQRKRSLEEQEENAQSAKRQKLDPDSKNKRDIRKMPPRRPLTRLMGAEHVALHPQKTGKVLRWFFANEYTVMSYAQYWNDYARDGPRFTPREIKRRYPYVEKSVLDRYGGLDPKDDPYPPQGPEEPPR